MTGPPDNDEIYRRLLLDEFENDRAESNLRMWAWVFGLLLTAIATGLIWLFVTLLR